MAFVYSNEIVDYIKLRLTETGNKMDIAKEVRDKFNLDNTINSIRLKVTRVKANFGIDGPSNEKYSEKVVEYIRLRLESTSNIAALAKEVRSSFNLDQSENAIRIKIASIRDMYNIERPKKKRLFFDIETSRAKGWFWRTGQQWVGAHQIDEPSKIICISYKWQGDNNVHNLKWDKNHDDRHLLRDFIHVMAEADELVAHNGDKFDMKQIRTRAIQQGVLMYPKYRTLDTLKKARKYFSFPSNKLDYLGEVLNVGRKLDHEGIELWKKVEDGQKKALQKMIDYCNQDVILLEDVFMVLSPYIDHNTNFAVISGEPKWHCPECASANVSFHHLDTTPMGYIKRHMKCNKCKKQYHVSNKTYGEFLKAQYHRGQ